MSHSSRDYTIAKQAFLAGMVVMAVVFGPVIRGALFDSPGAGAVSDRLLTLEVQNDEHVRLADQADGQAGVIDGLQAALIQVVVQVKTLAEMVNAMQQREYARLEAGGD